MKHYYLTLWAILTTSLRLHAQCDDQYHPVNTYTQFKWKIGDLNIPGRECDWEYYYHVPGSPTSHEYCTMPFCDQFNEDLFFLTIASGNEKDYDQENGWECVFREIGTPTDGVANPWWLFYNKFSGKLRIFYYKTSESHEGIDNNGNAGIIELYFPTGFYASNLLTGASSPTPPLDQYIDFRDNAQGKSKLSCPAKVYNPAGRWIFGEFPTMYDPCVCYFQGGLEVGIKYVNTSVLTATSTPGPYGGNQGEMAENTRTSFQTILHTAAEGAGKVVELLKAGSELKDELGSAQNTIVNDELGNDIENTIEEATSEATPFLGAIPQIGAVVGAGLGLLDFFASIGSNEESNATGPTVMWPTYNINGTITTTTLQDHLDKRIPGTQDQMNPSPENNILYTNPLGVFNLIYTPSITVVRGAEKNENNCNLTGLDEPDTYRDQNNNVVNQYYRDFLFHLDNPLRYVINRSAGFDPNNSNVVAQIIIKTHKPNYGYHYDHFANNTHFYNDLGSFHLIAEQEDSITLGSNFMPIECFYDQTFRLRIPHAFFPNYPLDQYGDFYENLTSQLTRIWSSNNSGNIRGVFLKIAANLGHVESSKHAQFMTTYPVNYNYLGTRPAGSSNTCPTTAEWNSIKASYYDPAEANINGFGLNPLFASEIHYQLVLEDPSGVFIETTGPKVYAAGEKVTIKEDLGAIALTGFGNGSITVLSETIEVLPEHNLFVSGDGIIVLEAGSPFSCNKSFKPADNAEISSFCTSSTYKVLDRHADARMEKEYSNSALDTPYTLIVKSPSLLNEEVYLFLKGEGAGQASFRLTSALGQEVPFTVQGAGGSYQLRHSAASAGVYILSVSTDKGVERRRIVLQ